MLQEGEKEPHSPQYCAAFEGCRGMLTFTRSCSRLLGIRGAEHEPLQDFSSCRNNLIAIHFAIAKLEVGSDCGLHSLGSPVETCTGLSASPRSMLQLLVSVSVLQESNVILVIVSLHSPSSSPLKETDIRALRLGHRNTPQFENH